VLDVAEALAARRRQAEVELLDVLVRREALRVAVHHDAPALEDVAVVRVAQRDGRVLLGQEEAHALLGVEVAHDLEDLLDDLRREAHRRLVEQDRVGTRHQRAADRGHLLLAAGRVAGLARPPLPEPREVVVDALERRRELAARHAARERAGQQVLLDRQVLEAMAPFHHLADAHAHELVGREPVDAMAAEVDRALRHLAALGLEQVRDRLERRALAGAVGAEQRDDRALGHLERDALQHQDHVVVDHLDVVHREVTLDGGRGRGGHRGACDPRLGGRSGSRGWREGARAPSPQPSPASGRGGVALSLPSRSRAA